MARERYTLTRDLTAEQMHKMEIRSERFEAFVEASRGYL